LSSMESDEFKKKFPTLAKEMEEGVGKADIEFQPAQPKAKRRFAGYNPDVYDFLRRCKTIEQAEEIIEYMKSKGEITEEKADELLNQLKAEGLRSFGSRKVESFYEKRG